MVVFQRVAANGVGFDAAGPVLGNRSTTGTHSGFVCLLPLPATSSKLSLERLIVLSCTPPIWRGLHFYFVVDMKIFHGTLHSCLCL